MLRNKTTDRLKRSNNTILSTIGKAIELTRRGEPLEHEDWVCNREDATSLLEVGNDTDSVRQLDMPGYGYKYFQSVNGNGTIARVVIPEGATVVNVQGKLRTNMMYIDEIRAVESKDYSTLSTDETSAMSPYSEYIYNEGSLYTSSVCTDTEQVCNQNGMYFCALKADACQSARTLSLFW
jgi:hypothetical protein